MTTEIEGLVAEQALPIMAQNLLVSFSNYQFIHFYEEDHVYSTTTVQFTTRKVTKTKI